MLDRRALILALAAATTGAGVVQAFVAEKPFTPAAFEAAQKAGGPILIHITAPWCPTCKAQKPILARLTADPKFGALTVFDVDFDSQKSAVAGFGARSQSTLIAFKGAQEVGRSVGDTRAASIEDLLNQSI